MVGVATLATAMMVEVDGGGSAVLAIDVARAPTLGDCLAGRMRSPSVGDWKI